MKTINYQNWQVTQYHKTEDDASPIGATSPLENRTNASTTTSRVRQGVLIGTGVYMANQVVSNMPTMVKNATGSTRMQENVSDMIKAGNFAIRTVATKGLNLPIEAAASGFSYYMRYQSNKIENRLQVEENKLLGKRRNVGGYYD